MIVNWERGFVSGRKNPVLKKFSHEQMNDFFAGRVAIRQAKAAGLLVKLPVKPPGRRVRTRYGRHGRLFENLAGNALISQGIEHRCGLTRARSPRCDKRAKSPGERLGRGLA